KRDWSSDVCSSDLWVISLCLGEICAVNARGCDLDQHFTWLQRWPCYLLEFEGSRIPFCGLDDCFHHISHALHARQVCAIKHAVLVFNLRSGSLFVCLSSDPSRCVNL